MAAQRIQSPQPPESHTEAQYWFDPAEHDVIELSSDEEEILFNGRPWTARDVYSHDDIGHYIVEAARAPSKVRLDDRRDEITRDDELYRSAKRRKTRHLGESNGPSEAIPYKFNPSYFIDQVNENDTNDDCFIVEERGKPPFESLNLNVETLPAVPAGSPYPLQIDTLEIAEPKLVERRPSKFSHLIARRPRIDGRRSRVAPYYDDPILRVRMYRGPGFEQFPIVLGSNPEHVMICNRWDTKETTKTQLRQTQRSAQEDIGTYVNESLFIDLGGSDTEEDECLGAREEECLEQILEVLPDVSHRFALETIRALIKHDTDLGEHPNANDVVDAIVRRGQYPKQRPFDTPDDGTGETIERSRANWSISACLLDAVALLAAEFLTVPTYHIHKVAQSSESLYHAYIAIHQTEELYASLPTKDKPYRRLRTVRTQLEKKYAANGITQRNHARWTTMINDMQAAKQTIARERIRRKEQYDLEATEVANKEKHVQEGRVVECQCCFDDGVPTNRMVTCTGDEGHQYCYDCVSRLAGERIGSMKFEMVCMSSCGCVAALHSNQVREAVPAKVFDKLAYFQQQAEIEAAGIEGLEQCPLCDFKGICEPVEVDPVFGCQNPDCNRMTCRLCGEPAHGTKTCEQVKKEKGISQARHVIEEARSAAMMRTCPKCRKKLIKESGCNKMRCQCGTLLCYVCQKDITKQGYSHFSREPNMCPQGDDPHFDRHEQEANAAERKAIRDIRDEHVDFPESDLQIETGREPPKSKPAHPIPPALHRRRGGAILDDMGMMPWGVEPMFPQPTPRVMPPGVEAAPLGRGHNNVYAGAGAPPAPPAPLAPPVPYLPPLNPQLGWLGLVDQATANPYWPPAAQFDRHVENNHAAVGLAHMLDPHQARLYPARQHDGFLNGALGPHEMRWDFRDNYMANGHYGETGVLYNGLTVEPGLWHPL